MMYFRYKTTRNVILDAARNAKGLIVWFDVANVTTACVQVIARTAWGGSPVFEVVVANEKTNEAAILLATLLGSGTYEITATAGMIGTIDCSKGYRYVGLRLKTASATATDAADILWSGKSDGTTGSIAEEPADAARGQ